MFKLVFLKFPSWFEGGEYNGLHFRKVDILTSTPSAPCTAAIEFAPLQNSKLFAGSICLGTLFAHLPILLQLDGAMGVSLGHPVWPA
jgi:hypothetical protein